MTEAPRSYAGKESALLGCPFCGCTEISLWTGFGTQADISCEDCGCERAAQVRDVPGCKDAEWDEKTFRFDGATILMVNRYLALEWNERAPHPDPVAQGSGDCGDLPAITERLTNIMTWLREPDWIEEASMEWLMGWMDRRPIAELAMVAMLMPGPAVSSTTGGGVA